MSFCYTTFEFGNMLFILMSKHSKTIWFCNSQAHIRQRVATTFIGNTCLDRLVYSLYSCPPWSSGFAENGQKPADNMPLSAVTMKRAS